MRLESVTIRGLGPFTSARLDMRDLGDARVVAVVGANGAGKSTLLELALPGALYRTTPTRGSLASLASTRDAMLEAQVVNGSAWTLRHVVDAVSGKSEAVVLDGLGAPATPDAKVRSFDAWAARHLPAPEVLLASMFAPQGASGFLAAKPGERKAILLRVLGVERLERQAEVARERAREARSLVQQSDARLQELGGEASPETDETEARLAQARAVLVDADARVVADRAALAAAQDAARRVDEERRRHAERRAAKLEAERQASLALDAVKALQLRLDNNRALLTEAAAIRDAVARVEQLGQELAELEATRAGLVAESGALERETSANADRGAAAWSAQMEASARVKRMRGALQDADHVEKAARELPAVDAERSLLQQVLAAAESSLEDLQSTTLKGADARIEGLRSGLLLIADQQGDPVRVARATLAEDDDAVEDARALPGELAAARAAVAEARSALQACEQRRAELERTAARAGEIAAARDGLAQAEQDLALHEADVAALQAEQATLKARRDSIASRTVSLAARHRDLCADLEAARATARKREHLERAEARISELEPQLADARWRHHEAVEAAAAIVVPDPPLPVSTTQEETALRASEGLARSAADAVAREEAALERALATAERRSVVICERAAAEAELADWTRLAEDLGRDGLQAAEIDAAGPELTELVNDLLGTCVGSRWTVTIETQRTSADGKKTLEGCEVRVLDTERGRDAAAETLSGGERVLVGEAIALALSLLACRRAGVDHPTLVRDETGAALDPANARAYVAMLRRAADIVDASHVLFVSHSPEVQDLADARIVVRDGKVEVAA